MINYTTLQKLHKDFTKIKKEINKETEDKLVIISAESLLKQEFPEPQYIIEGLLPEGLTLMVGLPKIGKSFLALHIALAVASENGKVLGYFGCKQGKVLYLALEDNQRRLHMRLEQLLRGEEIPKNLYLATQIKKLPDGLEQLREAIREMGINFIIIDTLARIVNTSGRKGNVYLEDYSMVEPLAELCKEENVSVLAIHHRRKTESEGDWTLDFSGSTGLTAVADNLVYLKRARGEKRAELRITGRDLANDIEMALEWDDEIGFYKYVGDLDAIVESEQKRQILDFLKQIEEAKPIEIARETGLKIGVVYTVLNRLKEDGKVIRTKWGFYKLDL